MTCSCGETVVDPRCACLREGAVLHTPDRCGVFRGLSLYGGRLEITWET